MNKLSFTSASIIGALASMRSGADGATAVTDTIVPEIFTPYVQQITEEKSRLIQSGAMVRDSLIDEKLAGGGLTFNIPSFRDLDNEEENISSDEEDDSITGESNNSRPKKNGTSKEVAVRLSRNQSWSSTDLASDLAGADPMSSIGLRVGGYWARRLQAAFVATVNGIYAANDKEGSATQGDMTNNIAFTEDGTPIAYAPGVTDFSAAAFIDAAVTMGDSMEDLGMVMVHSIVYARMQKNNLIKYIPDSQGAVVIPTFLGRQVTVDDGVTTDGSGVFHSWLFGAGAFRMGSGAPKVPTEVERKPGSGKGGGSEILYNRIEWAIHPTGYKFAVTPDEGGPNNSNTAGNIAHEDSWIRAYPERKMIKMARLITREY
jgi:hypothetical protein